MEQIINESDTNELKVKAASAPALNAEDTPNDAPPQLVNVAGMVAPADKTAGSAVPQLPEGKRGRGRPRKDGGTNTAKRSHKKKPATDAAEVPDYLQAAALYNMITVGVCKVISPEYEQGDTLQAQTIKAAADYFESIEVQVPAWAGLVAITGMNIAAALKTESGKSKVSSGWAKVRGWWIARKG